jgi:hypothetical protein
LVAGAILIPFLHGLARGFGELSAGDLGVMIPALALIGAALAQMAYRLISQPSEPQDYEE